MKLRIFPIFLLCFFAIHSTAAAQDDASVQNSQNSPLIQALAGIQNNCEMRQISVDEMRSQCTTELQQALDNGQITPDEFAAVQSAIPYNADRCLAVQNFHNTLESSQNDYVMQKITENQLYQVASDEADKLIVSGYASESDKAEMLRVLKAEIAKISQKQAQLKSYEELLLEYRNQAEFGHITVSEYKDNASAVVRNMYDDGLLTQNDYDRMLRDINAIPERDYSSYDFTATSTYPEGWDIRLGLTAGVILDTLIRRGTQTNDKYETATFWTGRDEEETLTQYGLTVAIGYQWFFFGIYLQQEMSWGPWLGEAGHLDSEFVGATYVVARIQYPFIGTIFRLGMDLGLGVAYAGGDPRSDRSKSGYHPAYIFDDALDPTVAFAFKAGFSFDFFVTDEFYVGFKIDCNVIVQPDVSIDSTTTYTGGLGAYLDYHTTEFTHDIIYLQPGIQLGYVF